MNNEKLMQKIVEMEQDINALKKRSYWKGYFQQAFQKTNIIVGVGSAFLVTSILVYAATVAKPWNFDANDTISSSEVNSNFDTLYDLVSGNLDSNNIASLDAAKITTGTIADDRLPTVIMWSGGSSTDPGAVGWAAYKTDICDINTASSYLSVNTTGKVTILKSGYYSVHAHTTMRTGGSSLIYQAQIVKNGVTILYSLDGNDPDGTLREKIPVLMDQVFYFSAGDYFVVQYFNDTDYAYYNKTNGLSGLQVIYLGHN